MDSSNREVLLWTREGMKGLWAQASSRGDLDTGQRKGSLWVQPTQKSALDADNREGPLWVRANTRDVLGAYKLEGVFWIRAGEKERFEHGQTLKDACEGALWKRKTLKAPLRSNTETYAWYFC